jgi:hypothetical protein
VPNYSLHKLFAGLRDAYRLCSNEKALQVGGKLADWFEGVHANLTDEQMQQIMVAEHGGINETLADAHRIHTRQQEANRRFPRPNGFGSRSGTGRRPSCKRTFLCSCVTVWQSTS